MLEKTLESLLDSKEIKPVNPKETQPWIFIGRTDAEVEAPLLGLTLLRCEEPTHWKSPWCWERLRAGGEGDNRGWDGCMASLTRWTWIRASSGRWRRTGKPGMLQSMVSQRAVHDWSTEQQEEQLMKYMKMLTWHLNSFEITRVILNTLRGVPWESWMI